MDSAGGRILQRRERGTTMLSLDTPGRRNALSPEMRRNLLAALDDALADEGCRVIILTGEDGHFCAGGDLRATSDGPSDSERTARNISVLQDIVRRLAGPKPIIAAVEGAAFGAGMGIAVACDFVIASRSARFCASFAKIGLCADAGLSWSLPRRLGAARSRQLMITARVVEGDEAVACGIADSLAETGGALAAAFDLAHRIQAMAPLSIAAIKAITNDFPAPLDAALDAELAHQLRLTQTADYPEGKLAFIERRPPLFQGH